MKYLLSENQLSKLLNNYFDYHFDDSVFPMPHDIRDYEDWEGLMKYDSEGNPEVLISRPMNDIGVEEGTWFSNGRYFENGWTLFGLDPYKFNEYLRRYVNEKYNMEIKKLF